MQAIEQNIVSSPESRIQILSRREKEFGFHWHYHKNQFELTLITKGSGQRYVGDSIESYSAPDLVLLPPSIAHTWQSQSDGDHEAIVLHFDNNSLGKDWYKSMDFKELHQITESCNALAFNEDLAREVHRDLKQIQESNGIDHIISFLRLLQKIAQHPNKRILNSSAFEMSLDQQSSDQMGSIIATLANSMQIGINIPELAESVHMSESSLRRFFKKNTGKSIINYFNEMKVSRACELLIKSKMNITEIAVEAGFNNLSFFNRKFLEIKKISPRNYRNEFFKKKA